MPVGANGESDPACAPLPTMIAIRNGGMRGARRRPPSPSAPSIAAVDDVARAERRDHAAEHEEHHRNESGVAAAQAHRGVRQSIERAVQLRLREEQRHAGQREEQLDREAGEHIVERSCRRCRRRRSTRGPSRARRRSAASCSSRSWRRRARRARTRRAYSIRESLHRERLRSRRRPGEGRYHRRSRESDAGTTCRPRTTNRPGPVRGRRAGACARRSRARRRNGSRA